MFKSRKHSVTMHRGAARQFWFAITAVLVAAAMAAPAQAVSDRAEEVQTETPADSEKRPPGVDVSPGLEEGSWFEVVTTDQAEAWQTDPVALIRVAEKYELDSRSGTIVAYLPDAVVEMTTDVNLSWAEQEAARSTAIDEGSGPQFFAGGSSCNSSIARYNPTNYYGWARGVVSFTISSGCDEGDNLVWARLQRRSCNLGCTWQNKASATGSVPNNGVPKTFVLYACVNGGNDWRTAGAWRAGAFQFGNKRFLTLSC